MLKSFSSWLRRLAAPHPGVPDPDGRALARLLFDMRDPVETLGQPPAELGLTQSQWRDKIVSSTELFFVAAPDAMAALRKAGMIQKAPDGSERAALGERSIPFFGYASGTARDDAHWGLELRRVGPEDLARRERHALREQEADLVDSGAVQAPRRKAKERRQRL